MGRQTALEILSLIFITFSSFPHSLETRTEGPHYLDKLEPGRQLYIQTSQAWPEQAAEIREGHLNRYEELVSPLLVLISVLICFTTEKMTLRTTWKSKKSLPTYWWEKIHNPYIAAGITSLGDERAIVLPLIVLSKKSLRSSLRIPILRRVMQIFVWT